MRKNEEIFKAYNENHEDDLFKPFPSKRASQGLNLPNDHQPKASDILGELFDSDSEQNISLHSAKTPITAFINRNRLNTEDDEDEDAQDSSADRQPST